jgi:hypothetical protein
MYRRDVEEKGKGGFYRRQEKERRDSHVSFSCLPSFFSLLLSQDNGIGMQMLRIDPTDLPKPDESAHYDGAWYRVKEPEEKAHVRERR